MSIWTKTIFAAVVLTVVCINPALAGKRVALVVGNDQYEELDDLRKAVNDAKGVGDALRDIGFDVVVEATDVDRSEFNKRVNEFVRTVDEGDTAFFFYAGHGVAMKGVNYLLPTDFPKIRQVEDEAVIRDEGRKVADIIDLLLEKNPGQIFLILDACRENPLKVLKGRSSISRGGVASAPPPAKGIFILYSAATDQLALDALADDDVDPNSVFTRKLIPLLRTPGLSQIRIAKSLQVEVAKLAETVRHEQNPSYYDEIPGEVYLNGSPSDAAPTSLVQGPAPETECDRLAAMDDDPGKLPTVRGNRNVADKALARMACQLALESHPKEARIQFQYARTLLELEKWAEALPHLEAAAKQDYSHATVLLAFAYFGGMGVKQDTAKAVEWAERGVALKNVLAMRSLALAYTDGHQIAPSFEPDPDKARHYLELAANAGDLEAMSMVAENYASAGNFDKGLEWWNKAIERGAPKADVYAKIASNIASSDKPDVARAIDWYLKAAAEGDKTALLAVGDLYTNSDGKIPLEFDEAMKWYGKAADEGVAEAYARIGKLYDNGVGVAEDDAAAVEWYEKGFARGDRSSAEALIDIYRWKEEKDFDRSMKMVGLYKFLVAADTQYLDDFAEFYEEEAPHRNIAEAIRLREQALEQRKKDGHSTAGGWGSTNVVVELARTLQIEGPTQDGPRALSLLMAAAREGDTESMKYLADTYRAGRGVTASSSEAVYWLKQAVEAGDGTPALDLSVFYRDGNGVEVNPEQSAYWFMKHAKSNESAAENLALHVEAAADDEFRKRFMVALQKLLHSEKVYKGEIDGVAGRATTAALQALSQTTKE